MRPNAIVIAVLMAGIPGALDAQVPGGNWWALAPLPLTRFGHDLVSIGGYVYATGGWESPTVRTFTMHRYDPTTDSWTLMTPNGVRSANLGLAACVYDGELYQFGGGFASTGTTNAQSWKYTPATDSWTRLADIPVPTQNAAAASAGGRLYLAGGLGWDDITGLGGLRAVNVYDPALNTWAAGPELPVGLFRLTLTTIGNIVYACGGNTQINSSPGTLALDVTAAAPAWEPLADMPIARHDHAAAALNNKLYVLGGWSNVAFNVAATCEFDPATGAWTTLADIPEALWDFGGATFTSNGWDRILVAGGVSFGTYTSSCYAFTPPAPPSVHNPIQWTVAGVPLPEGSVIGGTTIHIGATIDNPDGTPAQLEVDLWKASDPNATHRVRQSAIGGAGLHEIEFTALTAGSWQWRYRAINEAGLSTAWSDFGTAAIDFLLDQSPPTTPAPLSPTGQIQILQREGDAVPFRWTAATDDQPGAISYDLELSVDPLFRSTYERVRCSSPDAVVTIRPNVLDQFYCWRVRAIDAVGNAGAWSSTAYLGTVYNDGVNHGGGDAVRSCGFSAHASGATLFVLLLVLALKR